ncbi:MAG: c-type cytochrome [Polyangiaceae bacterium]
MTKRFSFKSSTATRSLFLTAAVGSSIALAAGCDEPGDTIDEGFFEQPVVTPESTVISNVRPPPIAGGTLLVNKAGTRAVVSDPDRDRVMVVDLDNDDVISTIALDEGSEPGRAVEDAAGRVHVALRRGGSLLTVDVAAGEVLAKRPICSAPRGLASFDATDGTGNTLVVACAGGEVAEIAADPASTAVTTTLLEPDLRDVVLAGGTTRASRRVLVSSFRNAHVLTLGPDMTVANEASPADYTNEFSGRTFSPTVAWRMVQAPWGATVIHQRAATVPIEIEPETPDGYGGQTFDCGSTIVNAAVTNFTDNGERKTFSQRGGLGSILLPVDIALSSDSSFTYGDTNERLVAFVGAGSDILTVTTMSSLESDDACTSNFVNGMQMPVGFEPIAVQFGRPTDVGIDVYVQLREPAQLVRYDATTMQWKSTISLGGESRADSGHALFHRNPDAPTTISCASCHPEGRDDSHTWLFDQIGGRRTQNLSGDVTNTAPFHWDGDLKNISELMTTVFEHRMGGQKQTPERIDALKTWLAEIPRIPVMEQGATGLDPAAVARGKALFESSKTECATCHNGPALTNNKTVDVGTGHAFQVPGLLGIRNRAPFMHDGCAASLHARFEPKCGGTTHGKIDGLTEGEIDDLVAYMESL